MLEFINGSMTVQEFTIIRNNDETVTVYLGDPAAPESDAEFIMQVHISMLPKLIKAFSVTTSVIDKSTK
jgi:hypothetical protein